MKEKIQKLIERYQKEKDNLVNERDTYIMGSDTRNKLNLEIFKHEKFIKDLQSLLTP